MNRLKLIVALLFTIFFGGIFLLGGNSNKLAAQNQEKTADRCIKTYRFLRVCQRRNCLEQ